MKKYLAPDPTAETESKQVQQQQQIVQILSRSPWPLTIHQICGKLQISMPTGLKLIGELQDIGLVKIVGKKETGSGRKPSLYHLNDFQFYAIGVEILLKRISVGFIDLKFNSEYYRQDTNFELDNTQESLEEVIDFIHQSIQNSGVPTDRLLGMGVGITGRVNGDAGESLSYFNFTSEPLASYLSSRFKLPVIIDNDTRSYGMAEKNMGKARNVKNAIVINLSRGLGTSLIVDNRMVNGGYGFAGELGHMQFGDSNKMCICGKRGCLGNDVSGFALEEEFKEAVENGEPSKLTGVKPLEEIRYDDILSAALEGDSLSIVLLQKMGRKLGRALGNIINLLNPELVIIGGKFAKVEDILGDNVNTGMANTALVHPLKYTRLEFSELGELAGLKGAGASVFKHFKLI
jgi:predicted NBD/HSP70 family sugar kinase